MLNKFLPIFLSLFLLTFVFLAFFSQASADDFCHVAIARDHGFIGSQVFYYTSWSGRYFSTAILMGILPLLDMTRHYGFIPLIAIFLSFFSIFLLVKVVGRNLVSYKQVTLATAVLLSIYLAHLVNSYEVIYWATGAIVYQFGNIFFILLLAFLFHNPDYKSRIQQSVYILGCCILSAAAIGSNESILLMVLGTVSIGTVVAFYLHLSSRVKWFIVLLSSLLFSGISILSPGNGTRASLFPLRYNFIKSLAKSILHGMGYVFDWSTDLSLLAATILFICIALPIFQPFLSKLKHRRYLLIFPALWLGLMGVMLFPAFWAMGFPPAGRTISGLHTLFLLGWFPSVGIVLLALPKLPGVFYQPPKIVFQAATFALMLGLLISSNFKAATKDLSSVYASHQEVVAKYAAIREAQDNGLDRAVVPISKTDLVIIRNQADITPLLSDPANQCAARYFNLKSTIASDL